LNTVACSNPFRHVTLQGLVLLAAVLTGGPSHANESLARKNDCLGCHTVATKLVGPAFKDIAAKYAEQSNATEQLVESIRKGSVGKWGELPMPAYPKISNPIAQKLARWILSTKARRASR
jgi:cytochrome c